MKTKVANLELEVRLEPTPMTHIRAQPPAKAVATSSTVLLAGSNFNMGAAVVRVMRLDTRDVGVATSTMYAGTVLHLPQRPSKWSARTGGIGEVHIGTCTSESVGTTQIWGGVDVHDSALLFVASAPIENDVVVVPGTRPAPAANP